MVGVGIDCNEKNRRTINKYKSLVEQLYKQPVDGIFEDATASTLQEVDLASDDDGDKLEEELQEDVGEVQEDVDKQDY